jgi:quercetin dioxygenase-like cupin family protein
MAKIALNPGEEFEHIHTGETYTTHLSGVIELTFNKEKIILNENQKVTIPAKTSHAAKNIGNTIAFFDCSSHAVIQAE